MEEVMATEPIPADCKSIHATWTCAKHLPTRERMVFHACVRACTKANAKSSRKREKTRSFAMKCCSCGKHCSRPSRSLQKEEHHHRLLLLCLRPSTLRAEYPDPLQRRVPALRAQRRVWSRKSTHKSSACWHSKRDLLVSFNCGFTFQRRECSVLLVRSTIWRTLGKVSVHTGDTQRALQVEYAMQQVLRQRMARRASKPPRLVGRFRSWVGLPRCCSSQWSA